MPKILVLVVLVGVLGTCLGTPSIYPSRLFPDKKDYITKEDEIDNNPIEDELKVDYTTSKPRNVDKFIVEKPPPYKPNFSPSPDAPKSLYSYAMVIKVKVDQPNDPNKSPQASYNIRVREFGDDDTLPAENVYDSNDKFTKINTNESEAATNFEKHVRDRLDSILFRGNYSEDSTPRIRKPIKPVCPNLEDTAVTADQLGDIFEDHLLKVDPVSSLFRFCVFGGSRTKPETNISAQKNLEKIKYIKHDFYKSSFIDNEEYFNKHWGNCAGDQKKPFSLSNLRESFPWQLNFKFTFYSQQFSSLTVSPQGLVNFETDPRNVFATQYLAPLMAMFDQGDMYYCDDEKKITIIWQDMYTKDDPKNKFTFSLTLENNNDITFAYKDVPKPIQSIGAPLKVGASDSFSTHYINTKNKFHIKKSLYNSISFLKYEIKSGTIIKLERLPSCPDYHDCQSCAGADPSLTCAWCPMVQICSSSKRIDSNYLRWRRWSCPSYNVKTANQCPVDNSPASNSFRVLSRVIDLDLAFQ